MINFFKKNKIQKGYAMLFTVIIVSAISIITAGLINATYKQIILSSLAKDSQVAFYQADTAVDCALYADRVYFDLNPDIFTDGGTWTCGGINLTIHRMSPMNYDILPTSLGGSSEPCFRINTSRTVQGALTETKIKADGYNICNKLNKKTVQRSIEINYTE